MTNVTSARNALPHINDAMPLTNQDKSLVDEVLSVLRRHNAERRFGLVLLHQHFSIGPEEVLVETTDAQARSQLTTPMSKSDLARLDYKVTSWRLDSGEPLMHCVCLVRGGEHSGVHQHSP